MNIIYTKSYDRMAKGLKKHINEKNTLEVIKELIENSSNFAELKNNPIAKRYNFERLKHQLNEFWSFYLDKDGGVIRLIVKPNNTDDLYLVFVSFDHYEDFSKEKVIYYDE